MRNPRQSVLPSTIVQGEEQMVISGSPEWSEYQVFRLDFQRGRVLEFYWLGKYKNDEEDSPDYMSQQHKMYFG